MYVVSRARGEARAELYAEVPESLGHVTDVRTWREETRTSPIHTDAFVHGAAPPVGAQVLTVLPASVYRGLHVGCVELDSISLDA